MPPMDLGELLGLSMRAGVATVFESTMRAIWTAALDLLRAAFHLADRVTTFHLDRTGGPVARLWPMMLWISGVLALGLFFWQLALTVLRGGRGFTRLVGGPVQYGIALAMTVGMIATLLAAADALTTGILDTGLRANTFRDALGASFGEEVTSGVKSAVLGLCALFGLLPAALGFVLEMLFRQAAIYVLVATIPLTAAGLLAGTTAGWFWRGLRWMLAAIVMKPVLALTVVLGVAIAEGAHGISGLLAGIGVLLISLLVPFVLFRLFAFVDPDTDAGAGFRRSLAGLGLDSYGAGNPALARMSAMGAGGGGGFAGQEGAHTSRFDESAASATGGDSGGTDAAGSASSPEPATDPSSGEDTTPPGSAGGTGRGGSARSDAATAAAAGGGGATAAPAAAREAAADTGPGGRGEGGHAVGPLPPAPVEHDRPGLAGDARRGDEHDPSTGPDAGGGDHTDGPVHP